MTAPLTLPEKPTGNTPEAREALSMLHRVRRKSDAWRDLLRNANKAKLALLADIFEESVHYENDQEAKAALVGEVNRLDEVQASDTWEATLEHDAADLILVTIFGIGKKKATKSQWLKAIRKGRKFGAIDRDSFLEWLEMKGGLIKAGEDEPTEGEGKNDGQAEESNTTEADATPKQPDLVARFLHSIEPRLSSAPVVELPAPMVQPPSKPGEPPGQRFVSMLGVADVDANGTYTGEARIVDVRIDDELRQRHMSLALPKRRTRTPKELRLAEERELPRVNRFAIKRETNLDGRLKPSDLIAFRRALFVLEELDIGRGKYFTGTPAVPGMKIWDGPKSRAEVSVANADLAPQGRGSSAIGLPPKTCSSTAGVGPIGRRRSKGSWRF